MAEPENPDSNLERLKAALTAAKGNPNPKSASETVKAALAVAKDNPAFDSILAPAIADKPDVQVAIQKIFLQTVGNVLKKCNKIGTTIEEVFETAEPFVSSEKDRESLINLHALLRINRALELLFGENYYSLELLRGENYVHYSSIDEVLEHAGMTREELTALPPAVAVQRFFNALPPPKTTFIDSVHEAADLIFEQRYGWGPGTAKKLTMLKLWLALEHALEDKPNDPKGIWKMTS